ncbi:MAG: hypothetical protein IJ608_11480 [Lachnospiraceae bacterium]|nr:hypothetical protein [Lachnospiraceae bacterium]
MKSEVVSKNETVVTLELNVPKDEMFDKLVIAPHNELNSSIYDAVDNFAERHRSKGKMKICIHTDCTSEVLQEKFRELFKEHYTDEYAKISEVVRRKNLRTVGLMFISIISMIIWISIFKGSESNLFLVVLGNIGIFSLWDLLNTQLVKINEIQAQIYIKWIWNSEIEFFAKNRQS